jgi:hypothetical protein
MARVRRLAAAAVVVLVLAPAVAAQAQLVESDRKSVV